MDTQVLEKLNVLPKVNCPLVGLYGNAFAIMGRFNNAARKAKWPKESIDVVMNECMSGDYDNLLRTISRYCADEDWPEDDDDEVDPWEDKD